MRRGKENYCDEGTSSLAHTHVQHSSVPEEEEEEGVERSAGDV